MNRIFRDNNERSMGILRPLLLLLLCASTFADAYFVSLHQTRRHQQRVLRLSCKGSLREFLVSLSDDADEDHGARKYAEAIRGSDASDRSRRDFLALASAWTTAHSMLNHQQDPSSWAAPADAVSPSSSADTTTVAPQQPQLNPVIPYSSVRKYKTIQLPNNGMHVLLVSDRRLSTAQAALSINGAGQFADPDNLPGCAHLMEHMVLSYSSKSSFKVRRNFEDWLSDRVGASNAFTAYQKVVFHFGAPGSVFQEALERFASLFLQEDVVSVCRDIDILRREVRRVDSELNFDNLYTQVEYIAKAFVNLEHPYSKFSRGSLETLERIPKANGIDVSEQLISFFRQHYLASEAVLVVVAPQDLITLERWVAPFGATLSFNYKNPTPPPDFYPGQFLLGNRFKHVVLYRPNEDSTQSLPASSTKEPTDKLIFEWVFNQDYRERGRKLITGPQIAFVLSQLLGRRGPGSLYQFLSRRGWIPKGNTAIPRVTLPVDVSGFNIVKVEITLTQEGFANRSNIVTAVYDTIETLRSGDSFVITRELMAQYASQAKLFGYTLAPRPPDAIELSFDAQVYGLEAVESGQWYRFPSVEDQNGLGLNIIRRAVSSVLTGMSDPSNALIVATVSDKTLALTKQSKPKWITENISGAQLYFEDMLPPISRIEQLVLRTVINQQELLPPIFNPLVPTSLRPARVADTQKRMNETAVFLWNGVEATRVGNKQWTLFELPAGLEIGLPLPRAPPEPSCQSAFVLQLLSPRAARADVRQAARAELWRLVFESEVTGLAELGANGGLAYDVSFNKYGLRFAFLGVSQTLPSYVRRMIRQFVSVSPELLQGSEFLSPTITNMAIEKARREPGLSASRRRVVISNLRSATAYDAASEGIAFLRSCTGTVSFAQGDLLRIESIELVEQLQDILSGSLGPRARSPTEAPATPALEDILYRPIWKPRSASSCSVAGVPLISDACGRIPR